LGSGVKQMNSYQPFLFKQTEPAVSLKYKDTEQVQLALGFPGFGYFDKKIYPLYLLSVILGGNMSSRLFISVRERRGLAYFVRCFVNIYQDTGNLVIQSGLDKSRLEEALKVILGELRKIKRDGVSALELKQAKEFLRGKIVLTLEDSSNLADWFAKQELLQNKILTPEEKLRLFDRVTVGDIKKIAREVLRKEFVNLALIGPYKDESRFLKLLNLS
jgi:predicted Zn-dependent peptidase